MIGLLLWTAAIIAFLISCPNVVALILEVPTMAKKRRKPLSYSPSVTKLPNGTFHAEIEIRKPSGELLHCRVWRFDQAHAEAALYDIEHFEPLDTLCSDAALRCLAADVRYVLRRSQPISLEQRLRLKVA